MTVGKGGFLLKFDAYRQSWTRLWVSLSERQLACFLSPQDSAAEVTLPLRDFVAYPSEDSANPQSAHFFVTIPSESWLFAADSPMEARTWIDCINGQGASMEKPAQPPIPQSLILTTQAQQAAAKTMQDSPSHPPPRLRRSVSITTLLPVNTMQLHGPFTSPSPFVGTPSNGTPGALRSLRRISIQDNSQHLIKDQPLNTSLFRSYSTTTIPVATPPPADQNVDKESSLAEENERLRNYIEKIKESYVTLKEKAKAIFERAEVAEMNYRSLQAQYETDMNTYQQEITRLEKENEELKASSNLQRSCQTIPEETIEEIALDSSHEAVFSAGESKTSPSGGKKSAGSPQVKQVYTYIFKDVQLPQLEECNEHVKEILKSIKDFEGGKVDDVIVISKLKSLNLQTKALFHKLCQELSLLGTNQKDLEKRIAKAATKIEQLTDKSDALQKDNLAFKNERRKFEEEKKSLQQECSDLQYQLDRAFGTQPNDGTPQRGSRTFRRSRLSSPASPGESQ